MTWTPEIDNHERKWLKDNGFFIREAWISPMEGWEFHLVRFGGQVVLKYAKSPRACFSYAVKLVEHPEIPIPNEPRPAMNTA